MICCDGFLLVDDPPIEQCDVSFSILNWAVRGMLNHTSRLSMGLGCSIWNINGNRAREMEREEEIERGGVACQGLCPPSKEENRER